MKKTGINLVPDIKNPSPDYYCTWQTQLYATSDGKPEAQRAIMSEKSLFERNKPYGWAYFYEKARRDLFLVMDDSWDVPLSGDSAYYGSLILSKDKFPHLTLKELTSKIKDIGWKGLGGWICAQESEVHPDKSLTVDYWAERLKEANDAGIAYWKVDWGKRSKDAAFRKILTEIGKIHAPELIIEHAVINSIIPHCEVFRTYDVPAIMSVPMTMEKLATALREAHGGLINCEDEAYIAASGGFTMGVMRHPYVGNLPNGSADMSFPDSHRNLKTKMYEILRTTRWHRLAPAFEISGSSVCVSELKLTDTWKFENKSAEMEQWWFEQASVREFISGDVLTKIAPAFISRNSSLPKICPDENGLIPFAVTSKNPNGAFSVCTCGRTIERSYIIPECEVSVDIKEADTVGVFGEYKNLTLKNSGKYTKILMQDLADDYAYDITNNVVKAENQIIIPGDLIHKIGTASQPAEDTSEPGVVIKIK